MAQNLPRYGDLNDAKFEKDLSEVLRDAPNMNELNTNVYSGRCAPDMNYRESSLVSSPVSPSVPPANSMISLSSPEQNGHPCDPKHRGTTLSTSTAAANKLDSLKAWSINTYKCTRQLLSERLGKSSRTVDSELEAQIEALKSTQNKYSQILKLARALTNNFYQVTQTQRAIGEAFAEMSQKSPELQEEFSYNSETQKILSKNGETLLGALNFFTSSINTLCNKTMEDTLMTIRQYENARVEYDAYRTDVELLQGTNKPADSVVTNQKLEETRRKFASHKEKYDRLRADVDIKLKFLEENKVKVMRKQLLLLNKATLSFYSGNLKAMESDLEKFRIQSNPTLNNKPSWLEQ